MFESLSPLIIGHEGGAWWDSGDCWAPIAGAAAPKVKPPARAALLLRSSLRFSGFEPMRLSFADEANEEIACGREYTPFPRRSWRIAGLLIGSAGGPTISAVPEIWMTAKALEGRVEENRRQREASRARA